VAIVSDDPLARSGLAALLAARDDVAVAGVLAPAEATAAALSTTGADAVLWDPGPTRAEGLAELAAAMSVVALLTTETARTPGIFESLSSTAAGSRRPT